MSIRMLEEGLGPCGRRRAPFLQRVGRRLTFATWFFAYAVMGFILVARQLRTCSRSRADASNSSSARRRRNESRKNGDRIPDSLVVEYLAMWSLLFFFRWTVLWAMPAAT